MLRYCTMAAIYFSKTVRFARPRMTMFGEEAVNRTTTIFAGLGPDLLRLLLRRAGGLPVRAHESFYPRRSGPPIGP